MNELIAPLIFAAVMSAGDGLQPRAGAAADGTATLTASAQARPAALKPGPYRSVESDGELRRGERLPARYQTHQYVIENWRSLRLAKPPRGHQWVQTGGSYALVAIATGRVAQVAVANGRVAQVR
ncbi:RcnB family protein [Massilia sp.]|uniref:RcnB family protein n=1 Tax=Massilia sp. TaxID=1882437 RepID=UPI0028976DD1|nr:RcnB family protein [Massilia sp.]